MSGWTIGFIIGALIVVIVAVLALIILRAAIGIRRGAERALAAGAQIQERTMPLWGLETTNGVAAQLANAARSLEAHATALAGALESTQSSRGKA